jgi:predicted  nucleic acid-binding Zn-ribbon protein
MAQEKLRELHDLDLALEDLGRQIAEQRRRSETFQATVGARVRAHEALASQVKAHEVAVREKERDVEALTEKKAAQEQKVLRVVNARELEALNHELARLAEEIPARETELLDLYELGEKLSPQVAASSRELERRRGELPALQADVDARVRELEARVSQTRATRQEAEGAVPPNVSAKYAAARKRHTGAILFEVFENACEGCGLPVPGFEWNRFRQNPGNVYECSNCGRLLIYVGDRM